MRRRLLVALTTIVVAFNVAPFAWMALTSLKTYIETQQPAIVFPGEPQLENYTLLFSGTEPVPAYLRNSLLTSFAVTLATLALSVPAAYALARLGAKGGRAKWKEHCQFGIISLRMMPTVVILVPVSIALSRLGLTSSLTGLVIVLTMVNCSFAVWLLTLFFARLPASVEEAGMLDGLSRWGVLWHIVLPLARTSLLVVAVFVFIFSWNELPFALVLTNEETATLPVYLSGFASQTSIAYQEMAAAGMVQILPVLVLTFFIQRHLVAGLSLGAVE